METLSSLVPNSACLTEEQSNGTTWTKEENKKFEIALALVDEKHPNRWFLVAFSIPGKSVHDVINQYKILAADVSNIEKGLVPIPGYLSSSFTFKVDENQSFHVYSKRPRTSDHERKKGVPWTEDEHRRFLLGLEKHGKGDWRSISRNYVTTRTPTQVASHAQKYFLRQNSSVKGRRRPSIHDIAIVDPDISKNPSTSMATKIEREWDENVAGEFVVSNSTSYPSELVPWNQPISLTGAEVSEFSSGFHC